MNDQLNGALAWALQDGAAAAAADGPPPAFPMEMLMPIGALILLFYFIVYRPQKTEQRKREQMIDEIGKGDQVITIGGIHGTVESYDKANGVIAVNVAPKVTMRFNRSAVSTVVSRKGKARDEEKAAAG